jgi:hypothetical protein
MASLWPLLLVQAVSAAPAPPADAYADSAARDLVVLARARRVSVDRSLRRYRVVVKERLGVGIRALRRDRMLYRREMAARIEWDRDSVGRVVVLGARQAVPVAVPEAAVPEDLAEVVELAFDPTADRLMIRGGDSGGVRHPLAPGSEVDYRFASGDSATLTFPDGTTLRLYELRVIPRRQEFRLMSGSLWIEAETHGVVRVLFRPARPFDFEQDIGEEDSSDIPGFLKPLRAEVRFVAIEYGLWERRWWLPRLVALDATASAGSFLTTPFRFERLYGDYEVEGDSVAAVEARPAPADSAGRAEARERCEALGEGVHCDCQDGRCAAYRLEIPPDTAALLRSADLPPAFVGLGDSMLAEGELRDLARDLGALPALPWQARVEPPRWGVARYNRVESLSLGARGAVDFGRARLDGVVRVALSNGAPEVEVGLGRETGSARVRVAAYRRLAVADPATRGLGLGNSLNALLLGRDDGDYYRATGGELTAVPPNTRPQSWSWRVYAERQTAVDKETDFSIPHVFDRGERFRPNLAAARAGQFGVVLETRGSRALGTAGATFGADVSLEAAGGTFDFARAALTVRATTPVGPLAAAVETAAGTSGGTPAPQSLFFLGGPQTLRGYGGAASVGEAFWRARIEVANAWPAARVALFADVGRAGPRQALSTRGALAGVGIGASFMDGLLRLDLTRAVVAPRGWRVDFYTDGIL